MNKNGIIGLALLCGWSGGALAQTTIIGAGAGGIGNPTSGNGNFESITAGSPATGVLFSMVPNWHWANGDDTSQKLVFNTVMNGADESASNGGYIYQNRLVVNDTGYTITAAGQVFGLSYNFGAGGSAAGWAEGDEFVRAYLFTATAPVDDSLGAGAMTALSGFDDYLMNYPVNGQWTSHANGNIYTTQVSDIGKTVYLALQLNNPTGVAGNPRIDLVKLDVTGGSITPPSSSPTNITVIAGLAGNADFEASEPASGAITYSNTVHWFNASGDEGINFTQDSQTAGSSQTNSRAGMPFQNRLQVNDTGYTVTTTGEIFNLSYDFGRTGGNWDGDEQMRTFLFTASASVDGAIGSGTMTESGSVLYTLPTTGTWTGFATNGFYVSGAGDVGKTFYFGMELINPAGAAVYPRIDVIDLNVDVGSTNQTPASNPVSGWQSFISAYGLSGYSLADADGDGQADVFEFAHGGDPTNAATVGELPYLAFGSNGMVQFHTLETNNTNPGIPYVWEWTDDLVSGVWSSVWAASNVSPTTVPGYNDVEHSISGTNDALYFRNRLFPAMSRPNILLILADDLGYADVSFNVDPRASATITTPNLDSLADSGTRFTSAYVVHPFCGPSRMGLMSGRYPHEFGGPFNLPILNSGDYIDQGISTNEIMISTVLQDAGYHTGVIGKWHMGHASQFHPNNRGFDEFYGFLGGGKNYFGPYQAQTGSVYDYKTYWESNGVDVTDSAILSGYLTDTLSTEGVRFITDAAATPDPFFLYMSYNAPHTPLQAKASDMAMFPGLTGSRLTYAAMVYAMDRGVGTLIQALKDTGQYDNTLIIFLSDNGGRTDQGASNLPLRGKKGDTSEGGFRVPMFLHWPNVIPAGVDYNYPVTALDFYPTLARLAEASIPSGKVLEGKEIWEDILANRTPRAGLPIYSVRYQVGQDTTFVGIRQDNWKALKEWPATSKWKLYNITNDIGETTDLSASYPDILSNMVYNGQLWATNHVTPLWYDNAAAGANWISQGMPHYDLIFTNSLP